MIPTSLARIIYDGCCCDKPGRRIIGSPLSRWATSFFSPHRDRSVSD